MTVVWTDPPVSTFSSTVLVNDLDLTVHYGDTVFYPNKYSLLILITSLRTNDRNNNVEMVLIAGNTIQSPDSKANLTVSICAYRLETKAQVL